ncbi:MAG: hypothetical protein U0822_24715 [Anaerolineae bacterium]
MIPRPLSLAGEDIGLADPNGIVVVTLVQTQCGTFFNLDAIGP